MNRSRREVGKKPEWRQKLSTWRIDDIDYGDENSDAGSDEGNDEAKVDEDVLEVQ